MVRLLFRGTKTFWKTKSYLQLAIFELLDYNIYEVIAYDPVLRQHTPRLYIDAKAVQSILICCSSCKEEHSHHSIDEEITTFLFNHIVLTEYLPQTRTIKIKIGAIFHEEKCVHGTELTAKRPADLPFMASPFETFQSYNRSNEGYVELPDGYVRHLQLSLRAKWRLPLILLRVSKSLPLRESDAKTWACFVHNKTNSELVESITAAISARMPSETRHVLRSAAHAALLPQDCPFPVSPSATRSGTSTPLTLSVRSTPTGSGREGTYPQSSSASSTISWADATELSGAYGGTERLHHGVMVQATNFPGATTTPITANYTGQAASTWFSGLRGLTPLTLIRTGSGGQASPSETVHRGSPQQLSRELVLNRTGSGGQASPSGAVHHGSPQQLSREFTLSRTGSGGQASPSGFVHHGSPQQLSRELALGADAYNLGNSVASPRGLPSIGSYQGTPPTRIVRDRSWGGGRGLSDWASRQLQQLYRQGGSPRTRVVPASAVTINAEEDQAWHA